jgi:predicted PurR-regulated permease PerM
MKGEPILSWLARVPTVLGCLAMIVGYHFWGPPGFLAAVVLFILASMLLARLRQNSEAAEDLRLRAEQARFQEPPPAEKGRDQR